MRCLLVILIIVAAIVAGIAAYVWFGVYNIAATVPHWESTHWFLDTVRDRSIIEHSEKISAPDLDDQELVAHGFSHYHEMCRRCHGAPGYSPDEFAQGLYPPPPDLTAGHVQEEWSDEQVFWVIRNGIKMTGMPAFAPTHDDQEIWGLAAFVNRLPELSTEDYRHEVQAAGLTETEDRRHGRAAGAGQDRGHEHEEEHEHTPEERDHEHD